MSFNIITTESEKKEFSWKGGPGYKPIFILIAAIVFTAAVVMPPPQSLVDIVSRIYPSGYQVGNGCTNITQTVNQKLRPKAYAASKTKTDEASLGHAEGKEGSVYGGEEILLSEIDVARMAKITLGLLFLAAFLWGTQALPIGATDILVGVVLYFFAILPIHDISRAYMADAVLFVFGIMAVSVGVAKTGLDKRIGLILLSRIKSTKGFAFIFLPLLAVVSGFLSEHALLALLIPVLMGVYKAACRMYGVKKDRALAIFLLLGVCLVAKLGGPVSPAAGGRNAIMVGYLMDYGNPITFGQWMMYGLPFVPVAALAIAAFMYLRLKPEFLVKDINPGEMARTELAGMPKFGDKEAVMAVILAALILLWVTIGEKAGLGGPALYAVMAMFIFRVIDWEDVQQGVAFDVVGLYAAACAMGAALKFTGGALWLAQVSVDALPDFMISGDGLIIGASILAGTMTNFMSDGATVAALGPVFLPMAALAGVNVWKVGLACAFSSSFANVLIVGTPNNAIAFGMGRDPETGERLLEVMDFVKYGLPVSLISWLVLWFWAVLGYWKILSW
jgi:solute carrier family 13 (sodium-dependent dicarboxylate transporter), member 2/3/5